MPADALTTTPAYASPPDDVLRELGVRAQDGLTDAEAARRLAEVGPNALPDRQRRSALRILVAQFVDVMVLVLALAAVLAGVVGEPEDTIAILAILVLNAVLGFVQERRAEAALAALRRRAVAPVRVRRAGRLLTLPADALVPGDIIALEAGNLVPADLRLVETVGLVVEEAALTGESVAVAKSADATVPVDAPVAERATMAYLGTVVAGGRGEGVVTATGLATELGRIAGLLATETGVRTPLQDRLARLGHQLALVAVALGALVFGLGVLRGEDALEMLLVALALAVAAVPEALPAVVTVALALGARRLIRRQVLVRQLPAVETLGTVTHICTDKTGTLTVNAMTVTSVALVDGSVHPWPASALASGALVPLCRAMTLANDAAVGADGTLQGDPTETALLAAVRTAGVDPNAARRAAPRIAELAFTAERARMTTLHRLDDGTVLACTKGAVERVLAGCSGQRLDGEVRALDAPAALGVARRLADDGLRVLAFAERSLSSLPDDLLDAERDAVLLGFVAMSDPVRPQVPAALDACRSAGIRVVMLTGDHPATARAIAGSLGLLDEHPEVLTGADLAGLDEPTLGERLLRAGAIARVAPDQKLAIVRALQAQGASVAMTGDGVNDAPALRRAEIGVAMGRGGTDVAREAAHMVLLHDDFASIVAAVQEGRRIHENIRRFVRYALTGNAAEVWTLLLAPFVGLPLPLLPIQLLWINLVTDGLPGVALAAEPADAGAMRRPPIRRGEGFFARGLWEHILWVGLLMAAGALLAQTWALAGGEAKGRTLAFTTLAFAQMGHALAIRSEQLPLWRVPLRKNLPLAAAVALTILLQCLVIYLPVLQPIFGTTSLAAADLAVAAGAALLVILAVELEKRVRGRRRSATPTISR